MPKLLFENGSSGAKLRVVINDSTTGLGKTGLTSASSGLRIAAIADVEATTTAYTSAGTTIEAIATLGVFAAPTTNKCRIGEVDPVSHPGLYEIQLADARWAVANAKSVIVTVQVTNGLPTHAEVQLSPVPTGSVQPDTGVVSASPAPTTTTFTATGTRLHAPTGGYTVGTMAVYFTSGANQGLKSAISGHTVSGSNHAFTMAALPAAPATGDTFIII